MIADTQPTTAASLPTGVKRSSRTTGDPRLDRQLAAARDAANCA
jgi:hypothetical protein